jgi:hypothetical protein
MSKDISDIFRNTSNDQMDDYGDDEEINICNICGHVSDAIDDYGNGAHHLSVKFAPLSMEISKQLFFHKSSSMFELYRVGKYSNAKCSFIKYMNGDIINSEREIKLIQSIIDNNLIIIGRTRNEIFKQMKQLGFDPSFENTFCRIRACDLCEERIVRLLENIVRKRHDIEIIKQIEAI